MLQNENMMFQVYSQPGCKWCTHAKNMLIAKQITFIDIIVGTDIKPSDFKAKFPGVTTLPLILDINDDIIGGYDDLVVYLLMNKQAGNT